MEFIQSLSIVLVFAFFAGAVPAVAAEPSADEMMREAQKLNMSVPEKGNSPLGTQESMAEMVDWLMECSRALIGFFNDTMRMLGLSDTSYVSDMNDAFDVVMKETPTIRPR
jgi:hypothetical protein